MKRKDAERSAARRLRRQGKSLRAIATELHVALSSVSVWVRDVPVPEPTPEPEQVLSKPDLKRGAKRRCGKCKKVRPQSAFNKHPNGSQWWCRDCYREYFRQRGDLHRRQCAEAKARRRAQAREYVAAVRRNGSCLDCGEPDSIVLEFDHLGAKRGGISALINQGASIKLLKNELDGCDLVCVNCHRRRTARRDGWRRAAERWWKTPPPPGYARARNMAYVYSYLERSSCADCGLRDMVVLDFDHVGEKTGLVMRLASSGVGLARLEAEITQCEVRCANCHRRRTHGVQRAAA